MSHPNSVSLSLTFLCYNQSKYIAQFFEDLPLQELDPLEIIILDDASTDTSLEELKKVAAQNPRIKLLKNEKNRGVVYSLARVIDEASGDYIYGISFDDKIAPGFFKESMRLLSQYPEAGLCCSDPVFFDESTGIVRKNKLLWSEEPCFLSPDDLAEVIKGGWIPGHTSIIKRSALLEMEGYIPELKWHCDWFALLAIGFRYGICYVPEGLAALRVSSDSYSGAGMRDWNQQKKVLNYLLHLLKSPEYRDVLPYFVRASVMSHFGEQIVRAVMENPEHWDMKSLMLIQNPLWQWNVNLGRSNQMRREKEQQKRQAIFERGYAAFQEGRLEEALSVFEKFVDQYPDMVEGHNALASVAFTLNDYQKAANAVAVAIKLNPANPEFYNKLGYAYSHLKKYKEAKQAYQKTLELDPANLDAYSNLAAVANLQGHSEEAGKYYLKALDIYPDNIELWITSGEWAMSVNDHQTAQAAFQRALKLDPANEKARQRLASLATV